MYCYSRCLNTLNTDFKHNIEVTLTVSSLCI